jgi:hypothetical protein
MAMTKGNWEKNWQKGCTYRRGDTGCGEHSKMAPGNHTDPGICTKKKVAIISPGRAIPARDVGNKQSGNELPVGGSHDSSPTGAARTVLAPTEKLTPGAEAGRLILRPPRWPLGRREGGRSDGSSMLQ